MKILSIGNSFSQDAQRWLHDLAKSDGTDLYCANIYIGGCSLERHCKNIDTGEKCYEYEINGAECAEIVSIKEALKMENWDVVTLQQVSQDSGLPASYEPYFEKLLTFVKSHCKNAKIYIHATWAYEIDSTHNGFKNYDCCQELMCRYIALTVNHFAKKYDLGVIPVGEAVQYCRENIKEFDYKNGGLSFNRDGFHLSHLYGRYLASLVWYAVITGKYPQKCTYVPEDENGIADKNLIELILKNVGNFLKK